MAALAAANIFTSYSTFASALAPYKYRHGSTDVIDVCPSALITNSLREPEGYIIKMEVGRLNATTSTHYVGSLSLMTIVISIATAATNSGIPTGTYRQEARY